ncbi:biotin synthase, partial [Aestuariibaculum marinum]|nr:biotin synthase [Aestuariibaculum marinum]
MDQMALRADKKPAALSDAGTNSTVEEAKIIYNLPFNDLLFRAQQVHRRHFDANAIQMSRLL